MALKAGITDFPLLYSKQANYVNFRNQNRNRPPRDDKGLRSSTARSFEFRSTEAYEIQYWPNILLCDFRTVTYPHPGHLWTAAKTVEHAFESDSFGLYMRAVSLLEISLLSLLLTGKSL